MLHNLNFTQLCCHHFVRILARQDRNLVTRYFRFTSYNFLNHKFYKLYDNAIFTHPVCHINLHIMSPHSMPPRFYNLNAIIPSLRFKVRDKSLTHISLAHSTCVPIPHKLFYALANRRRCHVTAPRCSIASSPKRSFRVRGPYRSRAPASAPP